MRRSSRRLWSRTKLFYEKIRNPVFHGSEISAWTVDGVIKAYRHLGEVYNWIDSWHDPDVGGASGIRELIAVPPVRQAETPDQRLQRRALRGPGSLSKVTWG